MSRPTRIPGLTGLLCAAAQLAAGADRHASADRDRVSTGIEQRTGHRIAPRADDGAGLPAGVELADGLSEDEAVAVALWNNRDFAADLARLGFARADLLQAGLLPNPVLSLLFPLGPKQLEATLKWPLDALWLRPRRQAAARLDASAVAEDLVAHGLALAAEVRVAHADTLLARDRQRFAAVDADLRRRTLGLAEALHRGGESSGREARAARLRLAEAEERRFALEAAVRVAIARLRSLLALEPEVRLEPGPSPPPADLAAELPALLDEAGRARPELRAAELTLEAEGRRAGLARAEVFSALGIVDANAREGGGIDAGPGIEWALPLFHRNDAGVARERARLERATQAYLAVRVRVVLEVEQAHARLAAARAALESARERRQERMRELVEAEALHAAGESSGSEAIEAGSLLNEVRSQESEAEAELRKAAARLWAAVGRKVG